MRNTDRILVLERIDSKNKDAGMVDPGVFEGKNNLHAVMDEKTCLWSLRYERGIVPGPLRERYTDFKTLKQQTEIYLRTKNIKITEVKD